MHPAVLTVVLGVAAFTGIVTALAVVILVARAWLVVGGSAAITVANDDRAIEGRLGEKLLAALARATITLPAACGGKGTCGQCRVRVLAGGGPILPTETALISRRQAREHERLACQVTVRGPLRIQVPPGALAVRRFTCTVRSNRNVATFIKEVILELPPGEAPDLPAGGYVLVERPPGRVRFRDFEINPPFATEWDRGDLRRHDSETREPVARAYSMANHPGERGILMLDVRIATPPPTAPPGTPPGQVSSYLFALRPGDPVAVAGPFGEFFVRETGAEMVFIGGGAGMAPMRAHVFDQLECRRTRRTMSFWYGARSRREAFYVEDFDRLAARHANFTWTLALSEPRPEDGWTGPVGFIHEVVYERYLRMHPAPETCEYYLCGPPLMTAAVLTMLEELGVERESILLDDFGS
jgi:Na+-transporting NADH:ubiquinone oxidoreductase subunit F